MNLITKRIDRSPKFLIVLLLVTCCAFSSLIQNLHAGSPLIVNYKDQLLTVRATGIPIKSVYMEIANQSGVEIIYYGPSDIPVWADFNEIPLDEGLRKVTGGMNTAFIYDSGETGNGVRIKTITIYPKVNNAADSKRAATFVPETQRLEEQGEISLPRLFDMLEDKDPLIREKAIDDIANSSGQNVGLKLSAIMLSDGSRDVRASAAKALGKMVDENAIESLAQALKDKNPWVRLNVVESLGRMNKEIVIPYLNDALKDDDVDVKNTAFIALEELKDKLGLLVPYE